MEFVKVCRICSIMGVKLHDLRSYPLESYYESVIGTNLQFGTLPPYACYECAALVRKFYFFRQKCLRSQAVLYGTTDAYGKLRSGAVRLIDREGLHIASNLNITTLPDLEIYQEDKTKINKKVIHKPFEPNKENKYYIGDHNYAALVGPSDDNEPKSFCKKTECHNKISDEEEQKEYEGIKPAMSTEDLEHSNKVPKEVVTRVMKKKLQMSKGAKHRKELLNRSRRAESKRDFAQYISVINLSLEEQKEEILKRKESNNFLCSPFQCNLCFKGFIDNDAWDHHVSKHSSSAGNIECGVCKLRFKTKYTYNKHASNHVKKYICKLCSYVSSSVAQAKQHQRWHKGITYKCKYCDEIFTMWTSYMGHMRIKHQSEFICSICGYSFISKLGLAMHKTMMHKEVQ